MMEDDMRADSFPGTLYAGDGMRISGSGPDAYTDQLGDLLPFKALVQASQPLPGDASLTFSDRLWVLPDVLDNPPTLPEALLYELADVIRQGGKVGLAARDDVVCDRVRDMLVMVLRDAKGRA